jgi:hypothetical protein
MDGIYIFGLLLVAALIAIICCIECLNDVERKSNTTQYHRV